MATEIRVPTLGESVTEATVGQWFKKVGDAVKVDEPLVELETDKVTLEVPAPAAGVIAAIDAKDGATVDVGALLGSIDAQRRGGRAERGARQGPGEGQRQRDARRPARREDGHGAADRRRRGRREAARSTSDAPGRGDRLAGRRARS